MEIAVYTFDTWGEDQVIRYVDDLVSAWRKTGRLVTPATHWATPPRMTAPGISP